MSDRGVAPRIEMLTYCRVRSASHARGAFLSNMIWDLETTSIFF
jgi:hypothetical protein